MVENNNFLNKMCLLLKENMPFLKASEKKIFFQTENFKQS